MNHENTLHLIDDTLTAMDRFTRLDQQGGVMEQNEKQMIKEQRDNLGRLRHKLASNELEVAVVGLEKAGKSKFSSAFVGIDSLFPSADERCTFTSTALRYGESDHAKVSFYSRKEFNENFNAMLADLDYSSGSLESLKVETFINYFESLKETNKALYNLHANKTEADIIDILEGRNKILPLLGQEDRIFEDVHSPDLAPFITNKHVSRAARSVTFYSKNLPGLENIVLYDVPGFDSPTLVHINQTIEKLKQVDAIVMVKNIKMPSLKGGEVDILVKNSDMDGIKLADKLFVFGSYADAVNSEEQLNQNRNTLIADLSKNLRMPFESSRLLTGTLDRQYEQILLDRGGTNQLEQLKDALRRYNENERTQILLKRINRSIEEIKSTFRSVVERTQLEFHDRREEAQIVLDLLDESRSAVVNRIPPFINPIKQEIINERAFTQKVIAGIDGCIPELDEQFIQDTLHDIQSADTRNVINFTKLNIELRGRLVKRIKEAVIGLVEDVSMQDVERIQQGILHIVLENLGVGSQHPKQEELQKVLTAFIQQETSAVSIDGARFRPLIERFIVDLLDTMILQPLGYESRRERFLQGKADLYMLSMFSEKSEIDLPYRSPLVAAVLAQKLREEDRQDLAEEYRSEFRSAMPRSSGAEANLVPQLVSLLAETAINRLIPLTAVSELVKLAKSHASSPDTDGISKITKNFQFMWHKLGGSENDMSQAETHYLDFLLNDVEQASSEEAVKIEIQNDLRNLVYLFKDSVVCAMNLELPFVSAITLYTERVREAFESKAYRNFISTHVRSIRQEDYDRLDNQAIMRETRASLVQEMREVLKNLESGEWAA